MHPANLKRWRAIRKPSLGRLLGLAIAAGVVTGVGALTRYAFGWVIIPVAVFLILFGGQRRALCALAAFGAFALVLAPWIIRNFIVSGTPFGTAGFAIVEGTGAFPGFQLERSIHPRSFGMRWDWRLYLHKFLVNLHTILQDSLPKLGGSWVSMLFLTGLLLSFRSVAVRRMRYFLLMCLAVFIVVQALGQTQLSEESPEVNSENLLVLLTPLVFIYGVSLFLILLEQMELPLRELRYGGQSRVCGIVLCADDFCPVASPNQAGGLSAVLSAGHPGDRRLDEAERVDDERRAVGGRVVWPAPMRLADPERPG